jgi:DNA-binding MarR family transcriptional regulator
MLEEHEQVVSEVSKLLFLCFYDLQRTVMQDWQGLNLTMAQVKVLIILHFKGPAAINKVADYLGISHPTASHLVDRLVQAGFVERVEDAADRRITLAYLNKAGEVLAQRLWGGRMDHIRRSLARLDEQDLAALRRGLRALSSVIAVLPTELPAGGSSQEEDD